MLIDELPTTLKSNEHSTLARLVAKKEEQAEKVKQEIRIIWGDYFKAPQLEQFPQIHALSHDIMQLASQCKQSITLNTGHQLLAKINQFSEIFWQTKNLDTYTATCPYPPELTVVYPRLPS